MPKPPLLVHLIFHPDSDGARELARGIHKALNADPAVPGLRVPTVFCPTDGVSPPGEYTLDDAEHSFVVVLADTYVVDRDSEQERKWSTFIGDLWECCRDSPHRVFPVQLHKAAWDVDDRLGGTNFVGAFAEADTGARDALVVRRLVIQLCRHLQGSPQQTSAGSQAPMKLFLSHAKRRRHRSQGHGGADRLPQARPARSRLGGLRRHRRRIALRRCHRAGGR